MRRPPLAGAGALRGRSAADAVTAVSDAASKEPAVIDENESICIPSSIIFLF